MTKTLSITIFIMFCCTLTSCKDATTTNPQQSTPQSTAVQPEKIVVPPVDPNLLTREMAAMIIKDHEHYPKYYTDRVGKKGWCYKYMSSDLEPMRDVLRALEQQGYVTFTHYKMEYDLDTYDDCELHLSQKAKPFLIQEQPGYFSIAAYQENIASVTGISQAAGATNAIVEYVVKFSSTPFTPCFNVDISKQRKYKVQFIKYDSGWQMGNSLD